MAKGLLIFIIEIAKYIHPYLLRGLKIGQPDQVWAMDITYIRLRQGFMGAL